MIILSKDKVTRTAQVASYGYVATLPLCANSFCEALATMQHDKFWLCDKCAKGVVAIQRMSPAERSQIQQYLERIENKPQNDKP